MNVIEPAKVNNWLLIDTSCPKACVSWVSAGQIKASVLMTEQKKHAENLPGAVSELLSGLDCGFADIDAIAVGVGPGSFIGIRIGIAYAKGIAFARNIPLVGVSSPSEVTADSLFENLKKKLKPGIKNELYSLTTQYGAEANVTIR